MTLFGRALAELNTDDSGTVPFGMVVTERLEQGCVNWLNNNAFSTPTNTGPGTGFGNVVKGSFRGPGVSGWDAGVMRTFPVYENTSFEFRAEYFNVLNHTILANPNTTFTNSAFGSITATQGDPRIAQFSLKFLY
jgi:hypothetical protein